MAKFDEMSPSIPARTSNKDEGQTDQRNFVLKKAIVET